MARLSRLGQLRLLLRRNWLLHLRDRKGTLLAVALPLVVFFFLASIKSSTAGAGADGGASAKTVIPEVRNQQPLILDSFEIVARSPQHPDAVLLYAPRGINASSSNSYVERIMDRLRATLHNPALIVGLESAEAVQDYWDRSNAAAAAQAQGGKRPPAAKPAWAAIVFGSAESSASEFLSPTLPCDVVYDLRLNGSVLPSSAQSKEFVVPRRGSSGAGASGQVDDGSAASAGAGATTGRTSVATAQYLSSGFLTLQRTVNQAILDVRVAEMMASAAAPTQPPPTVSSSLFSSYLLLFASFPSPSATLDPFHEIMVSLGPLYMVLSYLPLLQKLVVALVQEKEKGTKEAMKIAGLLDEVFVAGWYLTYVVLSGVPIAITSFLAGAYGFYETTSPTVLFALLFLYMQCLLLFAFGMSTLFSKSKLAGQVSSTGIFLLFLPQYLWPADEGGSASVSSWLAMLSPPIVFARGFVAIADAESAGVELSFPSHLGGAAVSAPYSLGLCLVFLMVDMILLAALAWYLERVVPGEYGMAKPWFFPCGACCRSCRSGEEEEDEMEEEGGEEPAVEVDDSQRPGSGRQSRRYLPVPSVSLLGPTNSQPSTPVLPLAPPVSVSAVDGVSRPDPRAPTIEEPIHYTPAMVGRGGDAQGLAVAEAHAIRPGIRMINVRKTFEARGGGGFWGTLWKQMQSGFGLCCPSRRSRGTDAAPAKGSIQALRGLSLRIARGEILALLGPNASGKTTTVSLLSGLLAPDRSTRGSGGGSSGRIIFEGMGARRLDDGGRDPLTLSPQSLEAVREHLFLCPQSDVFFDTLTVEEHLHFYAELRGIPAHRVAAHALQKLEQLGLGEKARERVKDLSGGQKRKLCVALALMGLENLPPAFPGGPSLPPPDCRDILALDEPSSGVDLQSRKAIWEVVQHYRAGRVTLLTTHSMAEAEQLADRIAILHRGVLKCAGSAMFLKRHYGQGYKLFVEVGRQITGRQIKDITELIQSHCAGAQRVQRTVGTKQLQPDEHREEDDDEEQKQSAPSADPSTSPSDDTLELTFLLPLSLDSFPSLFAALESPETLRRFHILPRQGLNVSLNSMEEIFFRVVEDEEEEDEAEAEAGARARGIGGVAAHEEEEGEIEMEEMASHAADSHNDRHPLRGGRAARHSDAEMLPPSSDDHDQVGLDLELDSDPLSAGAAVDHGSASSGLSLHGSPPVLHPHPPFLRVFRGLVSKRWQLAGRDKRSLFFLMFFPVLYVLFGLSVNLKGVDTAILHAGGSVSFGPSRGGQAESVYDRMFRDEHAKLPLAVHTARPLSEHSWLDGIFAAGSSPAAARTTPDPHPVALTAGSPRPSDPRVSPELDALDGYLLGSDDKASDHAFAYGALYVDESPTPAGSPGPSAGQPLALGSTFLILTNNSATHVAPVLTNALYSSMLRGMRMDAGLWGLDGSGNVVHTPAVQGTDPCPSRSISASSTPFSYASSSLLLQLSNFLVGVLIVVSLGYVPIYAGIHILKNEKLAGIGGSVGGGGEGASSNGANNSLAGCTNLSMQKLHGGSKFAGRFWVCNGVVDTLLTLQPVFAILALFAAVGNTLMMGPNFPAALSMFVLWACAMVVYTYLWTFRFGKVESMQLVLGLGYSTVNLVLFLVIAGYKLVSGVVEVVQDASDRSSDTHGAPNPFTNLDFDFEIVRDILSTSPGIVTLITFYPCFALPWGTLQLALQNYLNLKREASCTLESQSGAVGSGSSEDDGIAAPMIPCEPSSAAEMFVFERMGGVLLGLGLSVALSSLFLLWKERYLARWWNQYVTKTEQNQQQARFRVPPAAIGPAGAGWWALPQHHPPQQSQGLLMALPQSSPPALAAPVAIAPARPGPDGGDLELGRLVAAQAAAPLPSFVSGGLGVVAGGFGLGAGMPAPIEPADVAEERARVRAQFDAQGNPLPADHMDPIVMLELRKSFKLTEPIVLPPAELSPAQIVQLRAAGIDPAFAPNVGPPIILREKHAIANVSLGVGRGTTFGLLGPNGAGKSSMMSVLCGMLVPDSGCAFFHGASCVDSASSPAFGLVASNALGFVPQSLGLYESLTAGEHMQLYGRIRGMDERLIRARTRRFFRALKLTAHTDTLAEHLSGGSKRKLLLCMALIGDPSILLLDEVSTGVDVSSRKAMWTLLQSDSGSTRSSILSTHSMEEAEALSTRLGIMVNGTLRCVGRARTLKRSHGGGLELQVKLRAAVQPGHIVAPLEAPQAQVPALSPEQQRDQFIPIFTKFICTLVDASRVVPGSAGTSPRLPGHSHDGGAGADKVKDASPDDTEAHAHADDGAFDLAALPPLPGFPFAAPPSLESLAASSPASAAARALRPPHLQSARLVSHYNGLLTFVLPSTEAAGPPSSAASSSVSASAPAATAPAATSFSLSRFFAYMQLYREGYGIDDFALNQSTLDAVFLKFAREQIDPES